jgi:hypothetical protein
VQGRGEPDDLEAAVEAEWQAENKRAWEFNRAQSDVFLFVSSRDTIRERLVHERREAQEARIRDLQEQELQQRLTPPAQPAADTPARGVEVPYKLVQQAVHRHVNEQLGRRALEANIPGLGEWGARVVLYWYAAGKPAGLWLDDDERLCWGPAITPVRDREQREQTNAPTPSSLRLPRP